MNMDERLKDLPQIADEMLSNVQAGPALKQKILDKASDKTTICFRPLRAIPALCCALVVLGAAVFGMPYLINKDRNMVIDSQPAGVSANPVATLRADVPNGSLSLSTGAEAPAYRSIWAKATGSYFPLIQADGCTYRMLTTPDALSSSLLGDTLGAVSAYTSEPSLSSGGIVSNVVLEGETVYAVKDMKGAMAAANVDGKMRAFQRVSFDESALIGGETLGDTLGAASVSELTLSGVGTVKDNSTAQSLFDTLVSKAAYQRASCQTTSQTLLIKLSNGLTLQLAVNGEKVMACGTWACPEFFEAFTNAL